MHTLILFGLILAVSCEAMASPIFQVEENGDMGSFVDEGDYGNLEDAFRPISFPKRNDREVVYHPVPKALTIKQQLRRRAEQVVDEVPETFEGGRQKKQTRSGTMIFRLGTWVLQSQPKPAKKTQSYS